MIKIRRFRTWDISKIKKMVEYIQPELSSKITNSKFLMFPFDLILPILPLKLKFFQECFVAMEDKTLTGLIALKPDGKQKSRWKINRLIFNSNDYEIGKYLINYVISKYSALGVETFITIVDETAAEAISLFKKAFGFRDCAEINIRKLDNLKNYNLEHADLKLLEIQKNDAAALMELDSDSLYPHFRESLKKELKDFEFGLKNKIINFIKGNKVKRLALYNAKNKQIEGYILITTANNQKYWADIVLSLAYQEYYKDIMCYIINYVKSESPNASLYIYERKYYQSSNKLKEVLNILGAEKTQGYQVLVKDFWETLKIENREQKKSLLLFSDKTIPACNLLFKE